MPPLERVYNKDEMEKLSAELISYLSKKNPHIDITELAALLLYGSGYILFVTLDDSVKSKKALVESGAFAYAYLTSPIPERYATLPQPPQSGEV